MFENACSCDASLENAKENRGNTCEVAANLLGCLRHIEEMMDQLDKVLFNSNSNSEKPIEPDCLDSNIVIAFDSAKSIARHLEKVLGRL